MDSTSADKPHNGAVEQAVRRSGRTEKHTEKRPCKPVGNGFLTTRFAPVRVLPADLCNRRKAGQQFFTSLRHLCSLYGWQVEQDVTLSYPLNMLGAFRQLRALFKQHFPDTRLIICQDEKRLASLATIHTYDLERTLYYIPIRPVHELFRTRQYQSGNLLLSILACLHRAGVDNYHEQFVGSTYESLLEWLEQDAFGEEGEDEDGRIRSDLRMALHFGKVYGRQLSHPYHAAELTSRYLQFKPLTAQERQLKQLAEELVAIQTAFPDSHLQQFVSAPPPAEENEEDCLTTPDQYLSFIWDDCDSFYHSFWELVNSSLQEHTDMLQPAIAQYFDKPQAAISADFSYERRMFQFINDLSEYLYQQP